MKKSIYLFTALLATLGLFSCSSASSLSDTLNGAWAGTPERLFDSQASSGTIIETFTFTPIDTISNGGTVTITSLMSVTGAVSGAEGITQPMSVTASGSSTITGTYKAISADRIEMSLNMDALTVNVDPDAVVVNADALSGTPAPANIAALKPNLAQSISNQFRAAVTSRFERVETLNNVSLSDNSTTLKFKIGKQAYELHRQPSL